jgi:hypothetical protein
MNKIVPQELAKAIMVKNFDSFSDIVDWGYPDKKITLDMSGGEKWKALRCEFYYYINIYLLYKYLI